MSKREAPYFERGATYYGTETPDVNNLKGTQLEGKDYEFEDLDYSVQGVKPYRTHGVKNICRAVRNFSGISLLPKRLCKFVATAGFASVTRIGGYGTLTGDAPCFPIDEWLPSTGVQNYDLFYIITEGPATVLTDLAGAANNVWAVNDVVVALTAATSQATTAGRVAPLSSIDITGATSVLGAALESAINRIGRAMSARTTAQTNSDLLVNISKW